MNFPKNRIRKGKISHSKVFTCRECGYTTKNLLPEIHRGVRQVQKKISDLENMVSINGRIFHFLMIKLMQDLLFFKKQREKFEQQTQCDSCCFLHFDGGNVRENTYYYQTSDGMRRMFDLVGDALFQLSKGDRAMDEIRFSFKDQSVLPRCDMKKSLTYRNGFTYKFEMQDAYDTACDQHEQALLSLESRFSDENWDAFQKNRRSLNTGYSFEEHYDFTSKGDDYHPALDDDTSWMEAEAEIWGGEYGHELIEQPDWDFDPMIEALQYANFFNREGMQWYYDYFVMYLDYANLSRSVSWQSPNFQWEHDPGYEYNQKVHGFSDDEGDNLSCWDRERLDAASLQYWEDHSESQWYDAKVAAELYWDGLLDKSIPWHEQVDSARGLFGITQNVEPQPFGRPAFFDSDR